MRQLLQPITAFVYCNQAPPAAGGRRDGNFQTPVGTHREFRPFSKIILFHFMMEPVSYTHLTLPTNREV